MIRHRLARLAVIAFAASAIGCGDSVGLDGLQDAPLIELLSTTAAPGSSVTLRLQNASATEWGYNTCASPRLQRIDGGDIVAAPEPLILCSMELSLLGAGVTRTVSVAVPLGYVPGTYRIRYRFLRSDGEEAFPVSGSFTIE